MSEVDDRLKDAFHAGRVMSENGGSRPTKMEQRFRPGTVGDSLYHRRRYLRPEERMGLVPIRGDYRNLPGGRK